MAKNSKRQRENAENKLKCAVLYLDSVAFSLIPIPYTKPPSPPLLVKDHTFYVFFCNLPLKRKKLYFLREGVQKEGKSKVNDKVQVHVCRISIMCMV